MVVCPLSGACRSPVTAIPCDEIWVSQGQVFWHLCSLSISNAIEGSIQARCIFTLQRTLQWPAGSWTGPYAGNHETMSRVCPLCSGAGEPFATPVYDDRFGYP